MNCYPCKSKKSKGKIRLDDGYYNVSCKQIENTFRNIHSSGIPFNGHCICVIKCAKGFLAWIDEADSTSFTHKYTKIFDNEYDAFTTAKGMLSKCKERQLELF